MVNPCDFCDARCCKEYLVTVTSFDVLRVSESCNIAPEKFCYLAPCNILNYDPRAVLLCYHGRYSLEHLLAFRSWPCYFLKGGRCSIYQHAPLTCKQYPYTAKGKKMTRARCPAVSDVIFSFRKPGDNGFRKWVERYYEIVERWNSKRDTKEKCIDFLLKESRKFFAGI